MGDAGGPLAVLFVAIVAAEIGKAVSKETKIDILVTPIVTTLAGIGIAALIAAPIGTAASAVGRFIMWATELQPFFMGILVSVIVGIALTLPISSAAICAGTGRPVRSESARQQAKSSSPSQAFCPATAPKTDAPNLYGLAVETITLWRVSPVCA